MEGLGVVSTPWCRSFVSGSLLCGDPVPGGDFDSVMSTGPNPCQCKITLCSSQSLLREPELGLVHGSLRDCKVSRGGYRVLLSEWNSVPALEIQSWVRMRVLSPWITVDGVLVCVKCSVCRIGRVTDPVRSSGDLF